MNIIHDFINSDQGKYGYLFPYRKHVPRIKKHIFTDFKASTMSPDAFVISKMLNPSYLGWVCKEILNLDLFPEQIAALQIMWHTPFPMLVASRGGSKSFLLGVYATLRALLEPGTRIVIVGAGLRQSRLVFNYIETIWHNAPVFRSIVGVGKKAGPKQNVDRCYFYIGDSTITALPLGDGSKIRGFRANIVIADEFASINENVFDIVVRGFAATTKTPVDEAKRLAFERDLQGLNLPSNVVDAFLDLDHKGGNQIIYSGTAFYAFNHFSKNHDKYKAMIQSKGDKHKLAKIFGGPGLIPDNFSYKDFAIIRIPHTHLPDGLLDKRQLAHAKALLPKNIFLMEYGAVFIKDSDGFFPRSLVESCTTNPSIPLQTPDGPASFTVMMKGEKGRKYVIGIDPAAERDNLAIVVLEVWPNHARIVYCWAVNKPDFLQRKKDDKSIQGDYYDYCCKKIRDVVRLFNPIRIEMDSQGGGYVISEMLRDKRLIEPGDFLIYEIIDYDNPKETDGEEGRHILNLVKQTNQFNEEANVVLHKSLETKRLLFSAFDAIEFQAALAAENKHGVYFDTYEDCLTNIEELKNEICTIQRGETVTGKGRFDTPKVAMPSVEGMEKKGRLRKDRYTALLLSHKYVYENDIQPDVDIDYKDVVGNIKKVSNAKPNEGMYQGPGVGSMRNAGNWTKGKGGFKATKRGKNL